MRSPPRLLAATLLALALTCTPLACTMPTPGTSAPGQASEVTIQTAARVVLAADLLGASISTFLTAGFDKGLIARDVLQQYAATVQPPLQAALDGARAILQQLQAQPGSVNLALVATQLLTLQEAVTRAINYATPHGYVAPKGAAL